MPERENADDWYPQTEELAPRPRTRMLTPVTVVLMLALFAACGFVGGVLVEKQQSTTATLVGATATGRSASGATGASGSSGGSGSTGGFGGRFAAAFGGGAGSRGTIGTVTDISGRKLFVTTAAGTMVEVLTTPSSKITKSQSVGSNAIHPGDSVVVSGITASNGTVTAASVSDTGTSSSGGFASLFGGGGSSASTPASGGSTSLFGG